MKIIFNLVAIVVLALITALVQYWVTDLPGRIMVWPIGILLLGGSIFLQPDRWRIK